MAFGLSDDVALKVLVEEVLGTGPSAETITVPLELLVPRIASTNREARTEVDRRLPF